MTCGTHRGDSRRYGYFDAHHDSGYRRSFADYHVDQPVSLRIRLSL